MLVYQTLTLGTLLQRRTQVRGLHPLPPLEWQAKEVRTHRFMIVKDETRHMGAGG
jgi:hypothetical protein